MEIRFWDCDDNAVGERQAAAVQGVGFDGIDHRLLAPGGQKQHQQAQKDAADNGRDQHGDFACQIAGAESLCVGNSENQAVQTAGYDAHRRNRQARRDADDDAGRDQPQFASPRKGAYSPDVEKQGERAEPPQVEFRYHFQLHGLAVLSLTRRKRHGSGDQASSADVRVSADAPQLT